MKQTKEADIFDSILYKSYEELTAAERDEFHLQFGDEEYDMVKTTLEESQAWFKDTFDALEVPVASVEVYTKQVTKQQGVQTGMSPILIALNRMLRFRMPVYQLLMIVIIAFTGWIGFREGVSENAFSPGAILADSLQIHQTLQADSNAAPSHRLDDQLTPAPPMDTKQLLADSTKNILENSKEISEKRQPSNLESPGQYAFNEDIDSRQLKLWDQHFLARSGSTYVHQEYLERVFTS